MQICTGIARMRVDGDLARTDEYFDVVGHVSRVVQSNQRRVSARAVSNGVVTFYRERLWPAPWLYAATGLVMPASLLVFMPIDFTAGVIVALVLYTGCLMGLFFAAAVIEVTATEFVAGRARLPVELTGDTAAFRADEAFLERGQRLDARAWLLIRAWIDPVVRVRVDDPQDPTPYWLVSTRHPERLMKALERARVSAGGGSTGG